MGKIKLLLTFVILMNYLFINAKELPKGYPNSNRSKQCINTNWKFFLGNSEGDYFKVGVKDAKWETVSVPHTLKPASLTLDFCKDGKD
nr:hypothetical protein [uncultured Marinifilum sp.]